MDDPDFPRENPFAPPTGLPKEKEEKVVIIQQVIHPTQYPQVPQQVPQQTLYNTFFDCLCLACIGQLLCKLFCPCVSSLTLRL